MRSGRAGALPSASHKTSDPVTRTIHKAFVAQASLERASVLGQQAEYLLNESERLIGEAQQLLQDAPGDV